MTMSPPDTETWEDGAPCRLNDTYLPSYTLLYHNCSEMLESMFPTRFTCAREGLARLIPKFPAACRAEVEPAREEQREALRAVEGLLLETAAERTAGAQEVMTRIAWADTRNVRLAIFSLRRGMTQHLACLLQVREGEEWRSSSACLRFSPAYRAGLRVTERILGRIPERKAGTPQYAMCCPDSTLGKVFKSGSRVRVITVFTPTPCELHTLRELLGVEFCLAPDGGAPEVRTAATAGVALCLVLLLLYGAASRFGRICMSLALAALLLLWLVCQFRPPTMRAEVELQDAAVLPQKGVAVLRELPARR